MKAKQLVFLICTIHFSVLFISCGGTYIEYPTSNVEANGLSKEINAILDEATITELKYLGMPFNTGGNPPKIDVTLPSNIKQDGGPYLSKSTNIDFSVIVSPLILTGSDVSTDKIGTRFADFSVRFYNQNNENLTIMVDYYSGSESGIGIISHIVGDGTNFTVVTKTTSKISTCTADVAWTFSGKIIDGVIQDVTIANTMLDDRGDACDVYMGTGKNRVFSQGTISYALPIVSTYQVSNILATSATSGGEVTSDASVTDRGVCWSTSHTPTINDSKRSDGTGTGTFTSNITGLAANTTYYIRAFATNSVGTGYGSERSFKTKSNAEITFGTMTDQNGNTYKTVTIGTQTWMAENLRTTKFNDGTTIPNIKDGKSWWYSSPDVWRITPAYCSFNNTANTDTIKSFGLLYNWYTVNTGKVSPIGWHVPTLEEWNTLSAYLAYNGYNYDGSVFDFYEDRAAKSVSSKTGWVSNTSLGAPGNNQNENNSTGFNAIPCGVREYDGYFSRAEDSQKRGVGYYCSWWCSNITNESSGAYYRDIKYDYYRIRTLGYQAKNSGFSIRCVKD